MSKKVRVEVVDCKESKHVYRRFEEFRASDVRRVSTIVNLVDGSETQNVYLDGSDTPFVLHMTFAIWTRLMDGDGCPVLAAASAADMDPVHEDEKGCTCLDGAFDAGCEGCKE